MRKTPTPVQNRVLQYLEANPATTVAALTRHFGWASRRSAQDQLASLEMKGYVVRGPKRSIALVVTL